MADPQVPRIDDVAAEMTRALVAARPSTAAFVASGVYSHPLAGWRAQEAMLIARIADEAAQMRLPTAEGAGLRELAASELDTWLTYAPTRAYGEVALTRPAAVIPGIIRAGTKFRRAPDPTAQPIAKQEAVYEAIGDASVPETALTVTVPVRAIRDGAFANVPQRAGVVNVDIAKSDPLFDTTLAVTRSEAAGGSDGYEDPDVKRIARAVVRGRYAPTQWAVLGGALLGTGVKRAFVYEDPVLAVTTVYVADQSWASSGIFARRVADRMRADTEGFGCRASAAAITNTFVRIEVTVVLRSAKYLVDTTAIDAVVQGRVRAYFDDRDDWPLWKAAGLRAAISRAHRAVLACTSVVVKDFATGVPYAEPSSMLSGAQPPITHWFVVVAAITYVPPT